jgi:hypothetical protein
MAATTFNPSDKSPNVALSGGNLTGHNDGSLGSSDSGVRSIAFKKSGKYYIEGSFSALGTSGDTGWGITIGSAPLNTVGNTVANAAIYYKAGFLWVNAVNVATPGAYTTGDTLCIALDLDNEKIWVRKGAAGLWNGSGTDNPATNTGGKSIAAFATTGSTAIYGLFVTGGVGASGADTFTANFGDSAFVGTAPAGFNIWSSVTGSPTTTLANPTIG